MKLLAIDTATEACSAAVLIDDEVVEQYRLAPREHNRLILPMIEQVLADCGLTAGQLEAIAFGCGPGSFTGVRIAAGVAQGLALGLDLPVIPVSTLAALSLDAMQEKGCDRAFASIDARMNEVYWGIYERLPDGEVRLVGVETVCPADAVPIHPGKPGVGAGSGWVTYPEILAERVGAELLAILPERYPRSGVMVRWAARAFRRGGGLPAEQAQPVYLRDHVAKKSSGNPLASPEPATPAQAPKVE